MAPYSRRHVLQTSSGLALAGLAGCSSVIGSDQTPTPDPTCTTTPTERPDESARLYISEVLAVPDETREHLVIETSGDTAMDVSGYSLVYCGQRVYTLPDLVSDIPPRSTIHVFSGEGEMNVGQSSPPQYNVFVGSETSLLADEGMQLTIRDPAGEAVDSVAFPALDPGETFARPE